MEENDGNGQNGLALRMFAVGLGIVPVVFDTTIVNLALRTLARGLDAPLSSIQWVISGYLLALAMSIPISGWFADRLGGKRAWLWAMGLFLLGSVGCGIAWDLPSLVAFRVVQGIGGGILLPVMMTLFARSVSDKGSMGSISAFLMLPAVIGPMLGPVLCGLILSFASWRWIFGVNALPCAVSLWMSWRLLPPDDPGSPAPFDRVGFLLLSPGIASLLMGLSRLSHGGSRADSAAWICAGAVLVGLFSLRAVRDDSPLVDVRLLAVPSLRDSLALFILSSLANYGAMFLLPLYFQEARGATALQAGFLLVPQGLGTLLSRTVAGRLTDRIGPRPVALAGLLIVLLGTLPLVAIGPDTGIVAIILSLVVRGFGMGAVTIPLMACSFRDLDRPRISHGSVLVRIAMQLGGAFGTAILAVVLQAGLHPASDAQPLHAFARGFAWCAGFALLAVLWALRLPSGQVRTADGN